MRHRTRPVITPSVRRAHGASSLSPASSKAASASPQQQTGREPGGARSTPIDSRFPSEAANDQRLQAASRSTSGRGPAAEVAVAQTSTSSSAPPPPSSPRSRPRKCVAAAIGIQEQDNQQQQEEAEGSGADETEKRTFLSLEEAGLVEMSGLSTHERFLFRLTISSLNLLRVISEQEGVPIEELNAGRVCGWFLKDKLKREQNIGTAVLNWDDPGF